MNRRIAAVFMIPVLCMLTLSAAFVPTFDRISSDILTSPGMLSELNRKTRFQIDFSAGSDIDGYAFLADPVRNLQEPARYLAGYLAGRDFDWWQNSTELRGLLEGMDSNFPIYDGKDRDLYIYLLQSYFLDDFMSSRYGDERRAYVVASAVDMVDAFPYDPHAILGGATYFGINMKGGNVADNFGWDWQVNMNYDGASSLLNRLGGRMSFDARSTFGYAFDFSEKFSLGISGQAMLRMETSMPNSNYISARLSGKITDLFTEDFRFGSGIALSVGMRYAPNDSITFLFDLRNIPSFRSWYNWALTDLASFNLKFKEDKNIYFMPPDAALTFLYDRGPWHVYAEISDIVNQLIWADLTPQAEVNYYSVPKLGFRYDVNDRLSLDAWLRHRNLNLGLEYDGLLFSIGTKLDRFAISMNIGCRV